MKNLHAVPVVPGRSRHGGPPTRATSGSSTSPLCCATKPASARCSTPTPASRPSNAPGPTSTAMAARPGTNAPATPWSSPKANGLPSNAFTPIAPNAPLKTCAPILKSSTPAASTSTAPRCASGARARPISKAAPVWCCHVSRARTRILQRRWPASSRPSGCGSTRPSASSPCACGGFPKTSNRSSSGRWNPWRRAPPSRTTCRRACSRPTSTLARACSARSP